MSNFRLLRADEIDVRIGQVGNGYFTLLLYKDARADMNILDETEGIIWQRKHYELKGNMFCSVGIYNEDIKDFVWKDDCGTESFTEKQKGEASDSFKRACVNWGIGRELYTAPRIYIKCNCKKGNKDFELPYKYFQVDDIQYNDRTISSILISAKDSNNQRIVIYSTDKKVTSPQKENTATKEQITLLKTLANESDVLTYAKKQGLSGNSLYDLPESWVQKIIDIKQKGAQANA